MIEIPIPFALSLLSIELRKAIEMNTAVIRTPIKIIIIEILKDE